MNCAIAADYIREHLNFENISMRNRISEHCIMYVMPGGHLHMLSRRFKKTY